MFSFFKRNKTPKPKPEPKKYNVKRCHITVIEKSGRQWNLYKDGYIAMKYCEWEHIRDAWGAFQDWREGGKSGTLWVAPGTYIPVCNIDRIDTTLEDKFITREEDDDD